MQKRMNTGAPYLATFEMWVFSTYKSDLVVGMDRCARAGKDPHLLRRCGAPSCLAMMRRLGAPHLATFEMWVFARVYEVLFCLAQATTPNYTPSTAMISPMAAPSRNLRTAV